MDGITLAEFTAHVGAVQQVERLWDLVIRFYGARAIPMVSYHHFAKMDARGKLVQGVRTHGFPADWVAHYLENHLFEHDPIVALAARTSKPFFWADIRHLVELTGAEESMIRQLEAADLGDGLSVQVHGVGLRHGYVGLGFGGNRPTIDDAHLFELKCAAQIAHLRYCELEPLDHEAPSRLSPREREVMQWIARGKSNGVIAEILSLSRHTVDTLVRRIFEKLEVSDRTTAAVKALGAGIVLPSEA